MIEIIGKSLIQGKIKSIIGLAKDSPEAKMSAEYSLLISFWIENRWVSKSELKVFQMLKINNIYNNIYLYTLPLQLLKSLCSKKPEILQ